MKQKRGKRESADLEERKGKWEEIAEKSRKKSKERKGRENESKGLRQLQISHSRHWPGFEPRPKSRVSPMLIFMAEIYSHLDDWCKTIFLTLCHVDFNHGVIVVYILDSSK